MAKEVEMEVDKVQTETLAETENYMAWRSWEPDGEEAYHLELGRVTIHFFEDEWHEFKALLHGILHGNR
jgi:hypothetical protein